MNHPGRWRLGAMASAVALLGCVASLEAHAVALGRITVQSARGESLRAEIDISDLSADEASSLRAGVAGADVFRASGLEYSAAVSGLDVRLQRRPDGRPYLRLTSNRAINEPFVDLVLEARWASGRVTRDYTMLFDPPSLRISSPPLVMSAPVLPREPLAASALPSRQDTPIPYTRPAAARAVLAAPQPQAIKTLPAQGISGARQVTVRPGDNASSIAARNKPASVSLDQMLVALLRGNPEAFVGGNINLIKSGVVVDIPDAQAASAMSPGDARQTLVAQSKDFNTFRRKLADGVPAMQLDSADRQAGGKVQTRIDDRAQAVASPDRLTLSKGAVQGLQSAPQPASNAASPMADQAKNANGLNPPALPAMPAAVGTAPGLPVTGASLPAPASNAPAITATPPLGSSSAAESAAVPSSALATAAEPVPVVPVADPIPPASAPASVVPANQQATLTAPPTAPPEPGLISQILDNYLLLGGGILVALLAGLGFARYRKNAASSHVDSSFMDSRLQPDSFFGASGGQRVDTNVMNTAKSSSTAYGSSQLDAAGDVDPVAEADVYLAYGRDQQAEEILREALRTHPDRLAVHSKLLEIHAKRRDNKAFESAALEAFKLTGGQGPEWSFISQLGRELEPNNSLYQSGPGFQDSVPGKRNSGLVPLSSTIPQALAGLAPVADTSQALDFDLDAVFTSDNTFPAPLAPASETGTLAVRPGANAKALTELAVPSAFLDLDLNLDDMSTAAPARPSQEAAAAERPSSGFDFMANNSLDFTPEPFKSPKAAMAPSAPVTQSGMLEFDLNSFSLDLGPADKQEDSQPVAAFTGQEKDPLEIKFLLAEEFRILGDSEGARSLADEVIAHAKGPLKFKAQAFLNTLK